MVPRRRRRPISLVAVGLLLVVAAVRCTGGGGPSEPQGAPDDHPADVVTGPGPARAPAPEPAPQLAAGRPALVTVAVANVWNTPGSARPLDAPSLGNPVDIPRWLAAMSQQ